MSKTVLLTLGRLPKGLELARALSGAGHRVLVADPFGVHLSKPSRAVSRSFKVPAPASDQAAFLDALIEISREHSVDLIIPVSEEVMHVSLLAGRLPEGTALMCEPHETLLALHDKFAFVRHADEAGLRAPETHLAHEAGAAALAARADTIAKPRFGCSGAGLHRLNAGDALPEAIANRDWVIQRQISGKELSTLSLCRNGKIIAHTVYRGLIFSSTVAVSFERVDHAGVDDWVSDFAASTAFDGFIAFDFMLDAHGTPWPLECNPRLTSGIHFMDPDGLAEAVTRPDAATVGLKSTPRFQEGHTALTMAYGQILKPSRYVKMLGTVFGTRDVLWSSKDPLVFPLMTPMSWPVLKQVLFNGRSFGEAATLDIEWVPDAQKRSADVQSPHSPNLEAQAS